MSSYDQDYGQPVTQAGLRGLEEPVPFWEVPLVSQHVDALTPYHPAQPPSDLAACGGITESELLKMAANENVLGPSPMAIAAAQAVLPRMHLYPDGAGRALRQALAARLSVNPERVVLGSGSNELIELIIRTFVGDNEVVVGAWPSFVVYRVAAQVHGRDVLLAPLKDGRYDLHALASLIDYRTKVCFIANPNNPTGTYVSRDELSVFLSRIPRSVLVVLDEAYLEFVDAADFPDALRDFPGRGRLITLRTFSKAYGLAGLRVGYAVMDADLAAYVNRVRAPYNVNAVAQAAALAALEDREHLARSRELVLNGRRQLLAGFRRLGLDSLPSQANFVVAELDRPAAEVQQRLLKAGIWVRSLDGYGMKRALRVTIGTDIMNAELLEQLERILSEAPSS